jgi:hypothetical protein
MGKEATGTNSIDDDGTKMSRRYKACLPVRKDMVVETTRAAKRHTGSEDSEDVCVTSVLKGFDSSSLRCDSIRLPSDLLLSTTLHFIQCY